MTQEEWRRVYAVYEEAANLPPEEQAAFVESKLPDPEHRNRALQLLAGLNEPEDVGDEEAPPAPNRPELRPGDFLGRFQLVEEIGRGGMGTVYRATDPDLARPVAIKCFGGGSFGTSAAVGSFIREARMASTLNHPGIVTVHEVIRIRDTVAIVMELAEGDTLRRLSGAPQPLPKVAAWGRQIAEALAASHAAGLIHRDIKPENLMLRRDGLIKVLDFGLARHHTEADADLDRLAGTLRYMSPEQARGAALTPATDIFSLGIVLYELAAGVHPFAGTGQSNTTVSIAAAAATQTVRPPSALVPSVPRSFDSLIVRMLDKDPTRRPSAAEVAEALRSLPDPKAKRRRIAAGVMLAACVVLAVVGFRTFVPAPEPVLVQSTLLTGSPGRETGPAFSPDGQSVAYAWDGGRGGKRNIWIKRLDSPDPRQLTSGSTDEWDPCWLPDGSAVAFLRAMPGFYQVVTVPIAGGPERIVTRTSDVLAWLEHRLACPVNSGGAPSVQELVIADETPQSAISQNLHLYAVSLSTGARHLLSDAPPATSDAWPRISPDGRRIVFQRAGPGFSDLRMVDWSGRPSRLLTKIAGLKGLTWAPDGRSIFYQIADDPKNLWQERASGGAPGRPPFVTEANAGEITLDPGGRKIAYSLGSRDVNLWHVFADGRQPVELAPSTRADTDGAWSPDGTRFAFSSDRAGPNMEIWVASAAGTNARRVANLGSCGSPAWSPDGKWLAFDFSIEQVAGIGIVSAEGGAVRRLPDSIALVPSWSRDGKWIYFDSQRTGRHEIWKTPSDGGGTPVQVTHHGGFESRESPDGRYLYYSKSHENGLWRMPVSGEGAEEKVADFDYPTQFRCWELTAQGLYVATPGPNPQIDLLAFDGGRRTIAKLPGELPNYSRCFSVHPDGHSFLFPITEPDRRGIYVADVPALK